jgi:hypothetical protein
MVESNIGKVRFPMPGFDRFLATVVVGLSRPALQAAG